MPVDQPDVVREPLRRAHARKLIVALSFLTTLGVLLAISPLLELASLP